MSIFAALPAWAVGLLALLAGAMLVYFNWGWLLAVRAMLKVRRRDDISARGASASHRDETTQSSAR